MFLCAILMLVQLLSNIRRDVKALREKD